MRCQRAQQRLMAYHDSELSSSAGRRLEKHLESCDECSQLLEKLRLADHHASSAVGVEDVAGLPGMPPPEDPYWGSFTARVLDRVEEDAAVRAPEKRKPRRSWDLMIPRMAPAFSIALVVVVAAGVLMKIGDPMPVSKAPVVLTESAPEKSVAVEDRGVSPAEPDRSRRDYFGTAPSEGVRENESVYRPAPPSAEAMEDKPETEPASTLMEAKDDTLDVGKRAALALPDTGSQADRDGSLAAPGQVTEEVPAPEAKAEELPPPAAAAMDDDIVLEEADTVSPDVRSEGRVDQMETAAYQGEPAQVEEKPAAAPLVGEAGIDTAEGKGDQVGQVAAAPPAEALETFKAAVPEMNNNVIVRDSISTAADREGFAPDASRAMVPPVDESEAQEMTALVTPGKSSGESKVKVSGMETLEGSAPTREVRQALASRLPPYRGPQDQLVHAKNLADVRKFWESEQVLKDLLAQDPPLRIQEEASILLVKVLSSQNRNVEAQQVLDDARVQFPASETIQTYEIRSKGAEPAQ